MDYDDLIPRLVGAAPRLRDPAPAALLQVRGPDAREFLHRMCSQDLEEMADGEVRPAAFLDGKGKLLATCWMGVAGDAVWISTQAATGASLAEMLERFHFTEQLTVEAYADWPCVERWTVGDAAFVPGCTARADSVTVAFERGGLQVTRSHGASSLAGEPIDAAMAECLRIASGEALVGTDSEPNTLALELPIADHISTTKGCYTGQEIVARIHTYGHTNRLLCRLGIDGVGPIESGTELVEVEDGEPVGRVMSAADVPGEDGRLAFGFLPSALADGSEELALGALGGARVVVLPKVG